MKAAHVMAGAAQGGAELFYERLIPALSRAGDDILPVIRPYRGRVERLAGQGIVPVTLPFRGALDPWTGWRLRALLRRQKPRVAVAWMGRAAQHMPAGPWVSIGRLGGTYDLSRFRRCDHLVGNTPGMVAWIARQGFPRARTHLLPNFVADAAGAGPATLPVPPDARIILAMGRLHRAKGFDVLLAALTRLPSDVHAVIAGEGPERATLQDLASRAGIADRVHLLGWRSDTAALLAACDVFVCSSRAEPLGNVILEAFSARKPVVAAMADGPLWLLGDGSSGILVPVDSAIALASGIEGMLGNPTMARAMAHAGRARFERDFSEAAIVSAWRHFCATVEKA